MRVPNDMKLAREVQEIDLVLGGHDHHYEVRDTATVPLGSSHRARILGFSVRHSHSGLDIKPHTSLACILKYPPPPACLPEADRAWSAGIILGFWIQTAIIPKVALEIIRGTADHQQEGRKFVLFCFHASGSQVCDLWLNGTGLSSQ